jgi:hypothetical protein
MKDGTPEYFFIEDWENVQEKTFTLKDGKERTSEYIKTDRGWLRIDSIRLKRQLAKVAGNKKKLVLQRWVEGNDSRNTFYKVEILNEVKEISKSRKTKK